MVADYTEFVIYDYLAWIIRHNPELKSAQNALTSIPGRPSRLAAAGTSRLS